mgnify:CR=1 FL=1
MYLMDFKLNDNCDMWNVIGRFALISELCVFPNFKFSPFFLDGREATLTGGEKGYIFYLKVFLMAKSF